ncbi:MAG: phosphoenolpyruvate carboxykinase (ATP) [Caldisericales bacterium]|nr:phosphoenolpyruvate carboxykinase (ATP) [bacterium]
MDIFTKPLQVGRLIAGLGPDELREMARKDERTTEFGSASYVTKIRNRSAKFTEIVGIEPTKSQVETILKVREYLKDKEVIYTERTMCQTPGYQIPCRLYITKPYARIPYMWQNLLFPPTKLDRPFLTTIDVPEWPERKVIVNALDGVTYVLGTDYFGEVKKSFLRMTMYRGKQDGGLGLHAGSKMIKVRDVNGKLVEKGIILFGLSGTGKTTLTCHHHFLEGGEGVAIRQDDVVIIYPDTKCVGTEKNFYIKTEGLEPVGQPVLYNAAVAKTAVLENIHVEENGKVDFLNYDVGTNGRAVVQRSDIKFTDNSIDIPKTDMVVFITRRDDIVPPVAKLSPEQAAAFFMLGESIETSAGDPTKAGQSKREVGTNPFIVGPLDDEGNYIMDLLKKNPHMQCFLLNTGKIGNKEKIRIPDSVGILKQIARGAVKWRKDDYWGYEVLSECEGVDINRLDPRNYFTPEELKEKNDSLRKERRAWLDQFLSLDPDIQKVI